MKCQKVAITHLVIGIVSHITHHVANIENSIGDAHTPQPRETAFNTTRNKSRETVQRPGEFQSGVSYIKEQSK